MLQHQFRSLGTAILSILLTTGISVGQSKILPRNLPTPTTSTIGAVEAKDCTSSGQFVQKINIDGTITCGTPSGGLVSTDVPYEFTHSPDLIPLSPNAMDDEFNATNGTAVNTSTLWTWNNQQTATATQTNGVLSFQPYVNASQNGEFLYQPSPATPWTFITKVTWTAQDQTYLGCGLAVGDGTKYSTWGPLTDSVQALDRADWSSVTNISTLSRTNQQPATTYWLMVQNDGTNLNWSWSYDGILYNQHFTNLKGAVLGTITRVGIFATNINASNLGNCSFAYFRRTQ